MRKSRKGLNRLERKQVNAILNSRTELKENIKTVTNTSYNSSGGVSLYVFDPAQGDAGIGERIGDQVTIRDIQLKVSVQQLLKSGLHRVYAYQELEDTDPSGLGNLQPNDFYPNIQTSVKKYKVLFDRVFHLDIDAGKSHQLVNIRIPAKMLALKKVDFAAGSVAINSGQVHVIATTDNATTNDQSLDCNHRTRFYDQ